MQRIPTYTNLPRRQANKTNRKLKQKQPINRNTKYQHHNINNKTNPQNPKYKQKRQTQINHQIKPPKQNKQHTLKATLTKPNKTHTTSKHKTPKPKYLKSPKSNIQRPNKQSNTINNNHTDIKHQSENQT